MTVGVLLAHGWCFGKAMWAPLVPLLHTDLCITPDFGYFCEPTLPSHAQPRLLVGVGHSFGFLWLLKQQQYKFDGLVIISAVPSFRGNYGGQNAISNQDLISARAHISRSPQSFVRWFQKKCGIPLPDRRLDPKCINEGAILRDLEYLATWSVQSELQNIGIPIRVLGANNDNVVGPRILFESFKGFSSVDVAIENGGRHILPILNPEKCAATINGLIQEIQIPQGGSRSAKESALE